jgi:hypothetical protein
MNYLTVQSSDTQPVEGPRPVRADSRPAPRLAWGLWLLVVLVQGLLVTFLVANGALSAREWIGSQATWLPFLAFATVGAMILARRPGNRIGWLCWAIGFAFTLSNLSSNQLWKVLTDDQSWSTAWALAAQLGTLAWLGTLLGLLPFLILLFPTGRLPSRRWRPVAWTLGLVVSLYLTARLLTPGPVSPPPNPLGLESAEGFLELVQTIAGITTPFLALAVVGSLVLRFRRSRGDERQQLKWLTYVVAVDVVMLPAFGRAAEEWAPLLGEVVIFPVAMSMIPIAIGVAVLKYRLYDIDRVINRTLVYGLLTALLGAVYAATVLVLGQVFGGVGRDPPSWAVAGATLAVAALFRPARHRIQAVVDRRFNRRKYDAAKTVEGFTARLRDEVDLDSLSAELLTVVEQTMQPSMASLWLRSSVRASPESRARGTYRR